MIVPNSTETSDDVPSAGTKPDQKSPTKKEAPPKFSQQADEKPSYEANTRRKYDSPAPEVTEPSHKPERDERDGRDRPQNRERRRSRLENLPSIVTDFDNEGRAEERSRDLRRARSATGTSQREEDYFSARRSSRNLASAAPESMLSPDVIKHSTKGRDRAYWDYSGANTPSSNHKRNKSMQPEDAHHGKTLPNQRKPVDDGGKLSPTMTKRQSAIDVPRNTRRTSDERLDQGRNYSEAPSSRSDRKFPSPPQSQPERESLRPRAASFRGKREPSSFGDDRYSKDDRYSSSLHPEDRNHAGEDEQRRDERRRRRKSVIHDERNGYLATPVEPRSANGRVSKPSSPLASPRASKGDFFYPDRNGGPPSPSSRSATFPSTKDGKLSERGYPFTADSPERPLSRASTARSAINTAASSAFPVITSMAASTLDSPTKRGSNPGSKAASIHSVIDTRSASPSSPTAVSITSKQGWQPSKFDPAQDGSQPAGAETSYRRYSEDISRGELPDLPDCPRMREEAGHFDWLTLPRCNNFNICPSCYQSAFENTRFRHLFVPAPFRPDRPLRCDFGTSEWYHIAWLLTHKYNKPDLRLFHGIANVAATNQPCTGPVEDYRFWHTVKDPATQRPVRKFNICLSCAKTIEALLPNLFGVFIPMDSPAESTRGICDMHNVSYNGARKRFMLYFDAMETVSDQALAANRAPDMRLLSDKVREISSTDECAFSRPVSNRKWYTMRSIPEVTVCQECFHEVVMPELDRDDSGVQGNFLHKPQQLPTAACQLYSPRMRSAFQKAVRKRDLWYFEAKIRERRAKEAEIYTNMAGLDRNVLGSEWCDAEMHRLQREWQRWE